jgi:hypothetical protein
MLLTVAVRALRYCERGAGGEAQYRLMPRATSALRN